MFVCRIRDSHSVVGPPVGTFPGVTLTPTTATIVSGSGSSVVVVRYTFELVNSHRGTFDITSVFDEVQDNLGNSNAGGADLGSFKANRTWQLLNLCILLILSLTTLSTAPYAVLDGGTSVPATATTGTPYASALFRLMVFSFFLFTSRRLQQQQTVGGCGVARQWLLDWS